MPVWMQGEGLLLVLMYVLPGLVLGSLPQHLWPCLLLLASRAPW